jgi:arabinofuranan 3-O-arabinosyltransferase
MNGEVAVARAGGRISNDLTRPHAGLGRTDEVASARLPRLSRLTDPLKRDFRHPVVGAGFTVASIVFFVIFRTGKFLASGDVAPMIVDGLHHELGWQWTHMSSGAGGPTYEIARSAEVLAARIGQALGGSEALGQRLLYSIIWGSAAAAGASLARRFTRRSWVALAIGAMVALNPYTLVALPNPLPIVALGITAAVTSLCVEAAESSRRRWILASLLTVPCSYLSLNPPLLTMVAALVVVQPILAAAVTGTGRRGMLRVASLLVRGAPLAVALSVWWVVPAYIAIHKADPTALRAVTDLDVWSWTHARSSIANVMTLFGHWSWPRPEYYGRSIAIEQFPWRPLRWVVPALAFASPFVVSKQRRGPAVAVTVFSGAAVFVGKGLHAPFSGTNRWLYGHVPGFWLFREPAAKLGVVLVVLFAIGCAMTFDAALDRVADARSRAGALVWHPDRRHSRGSTLLVGRTVSLVVVATSIAPLVGVWPLWTGAAIKTASAGVASDRVALPSEWRKLAAAVNASQKQGKALVLPIDDYYQVPTTWGFYGADNLVRRLLKRPVLQSDPQLYVGDSEVFDALLHSVERTITLNDGRGTAQLLAALGVSHVIVRKDIDFDTTVRRTSMQRPETILKGLDRVRALRPILATSVADVYEVSGEAISPVQALAGIVASSNVSPDGFAQLRAALPTDLALSMAAPSSTLDAGRAVVLDGSSSGSMVEVGQNQTASVSRQFASASMLAVRIEGETVRLDPVVHWKVGSKPLGEFRREVRVRGLVGLLYGQRFVDRASARTVLRFDASASLVPVVATRETSNLGPRSEVLDCNNSGPATADQLGFLLAETTSSSGNWLNLRARAHSACVRYALTGVRPGRLFNVALQAEAHSERSPRFCLWVPSQRTCASIGSLERSVDGTWVLSSLWIAPPGATEASLYLYADSSNAVGGPEVSKTETDVSYRPPIVVQVAKVPSLALGVASPTPTDVRFEPGPHPVSIEVDDEHPAIGDVGDLGDCNRFDGRTAEQVGLRRELFGSSGVSLSARAHAACVALPLTGLTPAVPYQVSFDHRTLRGEKARYCVLDQQRHACVVSGRLDSSDSRWRTETVSFDANPGSIGMAAMALLVYADGSSRGTLTQYRSFRITPRVEEFVTMTTTNPKRPTVPVTTYKALNPAHYRVHVADVRAPFVLALSESWSPDWRLVGIPGPKAKHLKIDGYRNGWAIDATGDLDVELEYAPARTGQLAIRVSALAAALLALGLLFRWARRCLGSSARNGWLRSLPALGR